MYRTANPAVEIPCAHRPVAGVMSMVLSLVLLVAPASLQARAQASVEEYQVKAAFLFHFAQLIDWPAGALNPGAPSLNLCVFDDEPRRREFENTIEGKPVGARVLHVRLLNQAHDVQGCNILFLGRDEARRQSAVLDSVRGLPVLTVGETDHFLSDGGMIRFHLDQDRIRFDINLGAADSSHMKISSRLLVLAASVAGGATSRGR